MKRPILFFLVAMATIFMTPSVYAQKVQEAVISGLLLDSLTQEGEPYATLRITKKGAADKPVAMGVSDGNGKFSLSVKSAGQYNLLISSVGRSSVNRAFTVNKQLSNINLGTIFITESAEALKELEVVAQKPLVKMDVDQITYSVEDDPDAKANTILDMLRKVPMVTVDGQDNITVNGSSSFQVYLNGKPNPMISQNASQIFKAMPASMVKNIEVVTNPGAKYDAEGVGGILNITLIQAQNGSGGNATMEGYTANINAMAGNRINGGSAYVMVQKGDVTLSANIFDGEIIIPEVSVENIRTESNGDSQKMTNTTKGHNNMGYGNFDLSWKIDSLNTVSANFGLNYAPSHMHSNSTTSITKAGNTFGYGSFANNRSKGLSLNGSVDWMHTFANNPSQTLTLAYRISTQPKRTHSFTEYDVDYLDTYDVVDKNNMVEHTFQADYVQPVNATQKLEVGGKYILRNSSSITDLLDYRNTNKIGSLYGSYTLKMGPLGVKAGLRYEHTAQNVDYRKGNGEDFSLNYDNLVPSATLSMNLGMTQSLGLGYNMRITRPGISMLNPYVNTQDPTNLTFGNPNLRAEKSNNLQLTYSLFSTKFMLNATARYSFMNNGLEQYSYNEDGILKTTYGNIAQSKRASVTMFMSWLMFKTTRLITNSTITYSDLRSSNMGYSNNGWQTNIMLGLQQELPLQFKLSANLISNSQSVTLQGKSSGMTIHTFSLSKSLLKDRLTLSLTLLNPFHGTMNMKTDTYGKNFENHTNMKMNMQSVIFTANFRLGSLKANTGRKASNANDDLREIQDTNAGINQMIIQQ